MKTTILHDTVKYGHVKVNRLNIGSTFEEADV